MSYARQMLDTYSRAFNVDADLLAAAIDALSDCVEACNADNAADLGEQRGDVGEYGNESHVAHRGQRHREPQVAAGEHA